MMQNNEDKSANQDVEAIQELPSESTRMVNAAFEGFKSAYDIHNNFNATFSLPTQEVPTDENLYNQASSLLTNSNNSMGWAFAVGKMYNQVRDQQEQASQSDLAASSPKPNL